MQLDDANCDFQKKIKKILNKCLFIKNMFISLTNNLKLKQEIMTIESILSIVNKITRDNYTKLVKVKNNIGDCYIIVSFGDGGTLYGSYESNALYYLDRVGQPFRFRR